MCGSSMYLFRPSSSVATSTARSLTNGVVTVKEHARVHQWVTFKLRIVYACQLISSAAEWWILLQSLHPCSTRMFW